jgi:hypothetical protein
MGIRPKDIQPQRKITMSKLTISQFAFNLASVTRKVREAADPFHDAYTGATPKQRKDLRTRWMTGHLEGQGFKSVERILSEGKGEGAKPEHIKAIDRASSDFRYMVVRPDAKPAQAESHARLSREVREAAKAYLALFDKPVDAIKALRAVAN